MKLLLIDGNSMLNRAYFALPEWRNRSGEATAGVYGFLSMLLKTIEEFEPTHLVVVFDSREGINFRKELFVGYHANRGRDETVEEDIWTQVEKLKDIFMRIGVPVITHAGVEADDVIGTLCVKVVAEAKGNGNVKTNKQVEVIVVTGDRDLMQLVNEWVKLLMPQRALSDTTLVDRNEVKKRLGVWPEQVVAYKALVGDSSDNYPGVAGIGPKGAVELLEKFGSFEEIYGQFSDFGLDFEGYSKSVSGNEKLKISKPQFNKLVAGRASGDLSKVLATIKTDVPVEIDLDNAIVPNTQRWTKVFFDLGHKSLISRISKSKHIQTNEEQGELF